MERSQRQRSSENPSDQQDKSFCISDDLMLLVQKMLPAKCLFQFKLMSKHWLERISCPSFQEMHEEKSKKYNPIFLFHRNSYHHRPQRWSADWHGFDTKTQSFTNFTTKFKVHEVVTVSCLGLICFKGARNDWDRHDQIFLFNPSTKHILALPKDKSLKLPEDPIRGFGFGYLPSTKTYKVVQLFDPRSEDRRHIIKGHMKCEVIVVTNSAVHGGNDGRYYSNWRMVEDCPHLLDFLLSPAFIEETMYWQTNFTDLIIYFNIKTEKFGKVEYPNSALQNEAAGRMYRMMDLEGQLAVAFMFDSCMEIWKLEDLGGSVWERKYTIAMETISEVPGSSCMRVIHFHRKVIVMYSAISDVLMFYNPKKQTYGTVQMLRGLKPSGTYHESLFCLDAPSSVRYNEVPWPLY